VSLPKSTGHTACSLQCDANLPFAHRFLYITYSGENTFGNFETA
jgi:hypothetical protein